MAKKKKYVEEQDTDAGEGTGYVGTMSQAEKDAEAERLHDIVNADSDSTPSTGVAPAFLGRDPDADFSDMDLEEGEEVGALGSRVGFASVQHPRARMASAMHDWLGDTTASGNTLEDLSGFAEQVGMNVEGTGSNGTVLKADLVRAMDALGAEYPAAPAA
ncbi:MAG: hypothetical protein ABI119_06035 [Gemmatimonadaceae bacterium]